MKAGVQRRDPDAATVVLVDDEPLAPQDLQGLEDRLPRDAQPERQLLLRVLAVRRQSCRADGFQQCFIAAFDQIGRRMQRAKFHALAIRCLHLDPCNRLPWQVHTPRRLNSVYRVL